MKVLKIVGIIILILIVIIVILGLVAPKDYTVERSITIDAPKPLVFDQMQYWRNWHAWSPWAEKDSTMQVTIEGTDGEEGAIYKWEGEPKITGKGELVNTGVKENEEITYQMHFIEPMESVSEGYNRVADTDSGTQVLWGMHGETPFPWNIMLLFMNMDKMLGADFERGLDMLKDISEQKAEAVNSYEINQEEFDSRNYAAIQQEVAMPDLQDFFAESYPKIDQAMRKIGARMTGPPAALYFEWDELTGVSDVAASVPIKGEVNAGDVVTITVPTQTAYTVDYFGAYEDIYGPYWALDYYFSQNELEQKEPVIEEYLTDPTAEPDTSKWHTKIYFFAK